MQQDVPQDTHLWGLLCLRIWNCVLLLMDYLLRAGYRATCLAHIPEKQPRIVGIVMALEPDC